MFENGHTAPEHISPGLGHQLIRSDLSIQGSNKNLFDEYFNPSPSVAQPVLEVAVQDTPSTSISQTIKEAQSHVIPTSVEEDDHDRYPQDSYYKPKPYSATMMLSSLQMYCNEAYPDSTLLKPSNLALLTCTSHSSRISDLGEAGKLLKKKKLLGQQKFQTTFPKEVFLRVKGSGITPRVAEKQAGYVLTNLTLSSAELELQSMMDVSISSRGPCCPMNSTH
ncbi:hypothetical protein Tco_0749176 [Tanacetum coccineum]|uniref:Uncharacterized protein n=1 Tax=Tanacetum coccineum TaxID=301880 RepID=A0ABQ4YXY2_9ASTR